MHTRLKVSARLCAAGKGSLELALQFGTVDVRSFCRRHHQHAQTLIRPSNTTLAGKNCCSSALIDQRLPLKLALHRDRTRLCDCQSQPPSAFAFQTSVKSSPATKFPAWLGSSCPRWVRPSIAGHFKRAEGGLTVLLAGPMGCSARAARSLQAINLDSGSDRCSSTW
jgi:hypothetical protein